MLKKVQSEKPTYIECSICKNFKKEKLFKVKWQKKFKICNNCKTYGAIFNNRPAVVTKEVTCLKCGTKFQGTSKNRICGSCKETEGYRDGVYISSITKGVAL